MHRRVTRSFSSVFNQTCTVKVDLQKYAVFPIYHHRSKFTMATEALKLKDQVDATRKYFSFRDGELYCEDISVENIVTSAEAQQVECVTGRTGSEVYEINVPSTPVYIYSLAQIRDNIRSYVESMKAANLQGKIGYAIKANPSMHLLRHMREAGVGMIIAVSGYEVLAGIKAGFSPENILLNGNGKQRWEVRLAIQLGVMLNVDSIFDAKLIASVHEELNSENEVKVLLRIRPGKPRDDSTRLNVHDYIDTAENSKFGFDLFKLDTVLKALQTRNKIRIVGVHCHFGSCFSNPKVYEWLGETVRDMLDELTRKNIPIEVVNVGGGIGIDYDKMPSGLDEQLIEEGIGMPRADNKEGYTNGHALPETPNVYTFMKALAKTIPENTEIIIEPGRSLTANAGILACKVLGEKTADQRKFLVTDGSMNEVIRPCLYGSHHLIFPTVIKRDETWEVCDIVGPICESADFFGKNIPIQTSSKYVAVMDCGAYCNSMSSNYNLRPHVAEILVDKGDWKYIKAREDFKDLMSKYNFY